MPYRFAIALLILTCGAVYLLGNDRVPLWDRDEPRNAQAARQMLTSGDWVVPHFLDKVRTAKPPFTAWCQAIAMKLLGQNSFAARLPSAVAMTLTLIVLAIVLSKWADGERAFWTVFILGSSGIVIAWSARTSLTDAVLLLWVTIAQLCLFALWQGRATWPVMITWAIAVGLAGLTKGPVVLGVQAMTLLALAAMRFFSGTGASPVSSTQSGTNQGRGARATTKAIVAMIIIVVIVGPWLYLVEHRVPGFIRASTLHDVLQRMTEPLEQHKGPPGYYLLVVWGIYFPWSVLLPLTFVVAWRHVRDDSRVRFALAAIVGPWVMLECVQTKLPHYLLPVFPPLAYLTADAIVRCLRGEHGDLLTRGTRGAFTVWTVIVAALALAPMVAIWLVKGLPVAAAAAVAMIGVAWAGAVFVLFHLRRPGPALIAMGEGMLLVMAALFSWYLPNVEALRLSVRTAAILHRHGGGAARTRAGDVQMIAYKEPSLAFYQGGTIREQSENDFLLTHPFDQWPRFTVIRRDVWDRMPDSVKDRLEVLGEARGLDLADRGRTWTVYVLRKRSG
jgi:4-amino-4-deoxy-L-arabinose transferase-like glycosyltransferase